MRRTATLSSIAATSCLLGAGLLACGEGDSVLRIDLGPVVRQAQTLGAPIDAIDLRVTGRDGTQESTLTLDDPTFELSVQPGPIHIEATAWRHDLDPNDPTVTYFGDTQAVVEPLGVTDVALTMFPAGVLRVIVTISGDFALPDEVRVRFDAEGPRDGQSPTYFAPLVAGELLRVLPEGDYVFYGEASFDGETFEKFGPELRAGVTQSEITPVMLDF